MNTEDEILDGNRIAKQSPHRLIVGVSGASGVILAMRLLEVLQATSIETHVVISTAAQKIINLETKWDVKDVTSLANVAYSNDDIGAPIASGSFHSMGMIVIPCSIKTLSAIANAYSADLISRAADVVLKEGRKLMLVVRETPLHEGHIRQMLLASQAGAIIFPPVPAFYARPQNIDQIVDNIVGRVLTRMGIENDLYMKWENEVG